MTGELLIPHHVKLAISQYAGRIDGLGETLEGWAEGTADLTVVEHKLVKSSDQRTIERAKTIWSKSDTKPPSPLLVIEQQSQNIDEELLDTLLSDPNGISEPEVVEAMRAGIRGYSHFNEPRVKLNFSLTANLDNQGTTAGRLSFSWKKRLNYPLIRRQVNQHYQSFNTSGQRQTLPLSDLAQMRQAVNAAAQKAQA
jgi:hypothetical protein